MRHPLDMLGAQAVKDAVGFDWGMLANAGGELVHKGVDAYQTDEAQKKQKRDDSVAVSKSIDADQSWAQAEASLDLTRRTGGAVDAAQVVCDQARGEAQKAAGILGGDGTQKRCQAAQASLKSAATAAESAPKDLVKQSNMKAWQKVAAACGAAQALNPADEPPPGTPGSGEHKGGGHEDHGGGNFFTAYHAGLPTWGWICIGIGSAALVAVVAKSFMHKTAH